MSQAAPSTDQLFKQLCLSLRNADPKLWDQFVQCFDVYTMEVLMALSAAPDTEILRMQGRAQQCRTLLNVFATCHQPPKRPQQPVAPTPGEWAP